MGIIDRWMIRHCKVDWSADNKKSYEIAKQHERLREIGAQYGNGTVFDDLITEADVVNEYDSGEYRVSVLDSYFHPKDCLRWENPKDDSILFVDRLTNLPMAIAKRGD